MGTRAEAEAARQRHRQQFEGTAASRGYGSQWQRARVAFLALNPLCVASRANGLIVAADMVDHIVPHKGDMRLFWDRGNWQALSMDMHRRVKAVIEARWKAGQVGADDLRLDRPLPEFFGPGPGDAQVRW